MRVPKSSVDLLAALITTVECKNKIKAAEALGISPSALDKRLRVLSERMGVKLLNNNEESWTLSEAGQFFYPEAVKTLEYALLAEDKTHAHLLLRANHLLIGHSTYLAPKLLAIIRQLEFDPPSPVHIEHRSGFTADIVRRVLDGTLHAGFGYFPIQHPDLLVRLLLEEAFVVCLPRDHPLARRTQIRPDDLDQQAFIAVARETLPALHEEIWEHLTGFGITPRIVADAFTPVEALAYVEQKVGLCLLATSSAVAQRGIVFRPLSTRTLSRRSGFFVRDDSRDVLIAELTQLVLKRAAKLSRILVLVTLCFIRGFPAVLTVRSQNHRPKSQACGGKALLRRVRCRRYRFDSAQYVQRDKSASNRVPAAEYGLDVPAERKYRLPLLQHGVILSAEFRL